MTASRAAGVRLKKMPSPRLRCVINRTDGHFFFFGPVKPQRIWSSLRGVYMYTHKHKPKYAHRPPVLDLVSLGESFNGWGGRECHKFVPVL